MPNLMTPPLPSPTVAEIAAAVALLRGRAVELWRQVDRVDPARPWPHERERYEAEARAYDTVADWLATPIPAPETEASRG